MATEVRGPRIEELVDPLEGFCWHDGDHLAGLPAVIADPLRPTGALLNAHLDALQQVLATAAERLEPAPGGGRMPTEEDLDDLRTLHRTLDRLTHEYAASLVLVGAAPDRRGGRVVGTAHLLGVRARTPLGLLRPPPPRDVRDRPAADRAVALERHRAALAAVTAAATAAGADPREAADAIDWVLCDWLHADRARPDGVAAGIPQDRAEDAAMVVRAAHAAIRCRAAVDPSLLDLPG